jgi:hypothetical protein
MTRKFRYDISGTGAGGEAFSIKGEFESSETFVEASVEAQRQAFRQLRSGDAPPECGGPFAVERILVEVVKA